MCRVAQLLPTFNNKRVLAGAAQAVLSDYLSAEQQGSHCPLLPCL